MQGVTLPIASKALPFDQKNDRDFEEMTIRIMTGLDSIRKNKSLSPTQHTLAKLAQCSRRTLSLRGWPIEELKKIKEPSHAKGKNEVVDSRSKKSKGSESETQLIAQIRNYQNQNGKLFDRVQYLEEKASRSTVVNDALEEQTKALMEKVQDLEKELRKTKVRAVGAKSTAKS